MSTGLILNVTEGKPPENWDQGLQEAQYEAGLCQSSYWARVISEVDHAQPYFINITDQKNKSLLSLLFFHKIPWNRLKQRKEDWRLFANDQLGWLEWIDGPVCDIPDGKTRTNALSLLLNFLNGHALKNRFSKIRSYGFSIASQLRTDQKTEVLFKKNGYESKRWATILVDLNRSENEIWMRLEHVARKSVKKARSYETKIFQIHTFEELRTKFYLPYVEFKGKESQQNYSLPVAKTMWENDDRKYYRYFVAESPQGETLGTLGMYLFNGVATEIASSISLQALTQKNPVQDLLHWEMFIEAKKAGCQIFNLAGVNPNPTTEKEKGIRRFKDKWGGQYVEYLQYEKAIAKDSITRKFAKYLFHKIKRTKKQ